MFVPKLIVCLREGYSWPRFRADAGAGVIVALVALPLAMAFAIASGLPPERGMYTAIVAGFLISALGGSRVQIGGPTGAFVIVVAGVVMHDGYDGLALATLMAGVILILMGVTRLGETVKYIPFSVTTGFTSGIAVVIFSSQLRDFFGLHLEAMPASALGQWKTCIAAASTINPAAVAIGAFTAGLIAVWPKAWQKIPASIVALTTTALAVSVFQWPVETIGSRFGQIPHGLPAFHWPEWSWNRVQALVPSATTIALLGAIESLLSAVVADGMIGGRHKSSTELIGQGMANIASPLFGGLPATGAIARTVTNVKNGGRTPVAGIVHSIVLLGVLLAAGPLAARVPLAALAGVLIIVCYHMSEWRSVRFVLSGPRSDQVVLATTFLLTIFVSLTTAVEVGMVLAALLFMRELADLTQVRALTREDGAGEALVTERIPPGIEVYSVHGSFFFGAAHKVLEVRRIMNQRPRALVLDLSAVPYLDTTGLHVLEQILRESIHRGTRFLLAGVQPQPRSVLKQAGMIDKIGPGHFARDLTAALEKLR